VAPKVPAEGKTVLKTGLAVQQAEMAKISEPLPRRVSTTPTALSANSQSPRRDFGHANKALGSDII
jgi:hypothetical protein